MAKNSGFNSWSELSRVASKCRSMMLINSPRIRRNNCKTSDFDCLMKNTDKYMKEFKKQDIPVDYGILINFPQPSAKSCNTKVEFVVV